MTTKESNIERWPSRKGRLITVDTGGSPPSRTVWKWRTGGSHIKAYCEDGRAADVEARQIVTTRRGLDEDGEEQVGPPPVTPGDVAAWLLTLP